MPSSPIIWSHRGSRCSEDLDRAGRPSPSQRHLPHGRSAACTEDRSGENLHDAAVGSRLRCRSPTYLTAARVGRPSEVAEGRGSAPSVWPLTAWSATAVQGLRPAGSVHDMSDALEIPVLTGAGVTLRPHTMGDLHRVLERCRSRDRSWPSTMRSARSAGNCWSGRPMWISTAALRPGVAEPPRRDAGRLALGSKAGNGPSPNAGPG